MAEGLYRPAELAIPGVAADPLCAAMVRILPKTELVLDLAPTAGEARSRGRNETLSDGGERWYRYFTPDDLANVDDPEFAMGMVRHEFTLAVKAGRAFPVVVPLDGGWEWREATDVWLVSNPPAARALEADETGLLHPREDTALLRIDPPPGAHLRLSERRARLGEPVWMAGFPLRSARFAQSRLGHRYDDADGTLRVSAGKVTDVDGADYFTTDLDGSMGNSGSPVFDAAGGVIGMFSRATGQGARNALEYGHVQRVHVSTALALRGLGLRRGGEGAG